VPSRSLHETELPHLTELHLQAWEGRIEADLQLGRAEDVVGELSRLVDQHPLRERLWEQLMLALYRTGRQADALTAFQKARGVLQAELGVEPGPALREMQRRILDADADLLTGPAKLPAQLAQLPLDVRGFVGRDLELAQLDAIMVDAGQRPTSVAIAVVSGTAGVGKTALAVRWAHQIRDQFPDGQLYVDLRGYDPGQPMTGGDALAGFLTALGVAGPDIPLEVDQRAARFRTEIADRRILIVLDNASTVEQVRPLLPGTPTCTVVVTSRDSLGGLVAAHGAHRLELDLLPPADARTLLRRLIGDRVEVEPDSAATLARQCAWLPIALRIAADLAVSRPTAPLAQLVAELENRQGRLDLLDAGGDPRVEVRAVFSWSVQHLPPEDARVFALLGLHPGPDADLYAVAALADVSLDQARRTLVGLTRAHLVQRTNAGRYHMHDLLRAYATGLANAPEADPEAALGRLFDYYLAVAASAVDRLYPAEAHHRPRIAPAADPAPALTDPDSAGRWLNSERACLTAIAGQSAAHGRSTHAIQLSTTLFRYLASGGHPTDALSIHGHARDAARRIGDRPGEAQALLGLGVTRYRRGSHEAAADYYAQALTLFRQAGDRTGEARAVGNLGIAEGRLGRYGPAAEHHREALGLFMDAGDRTGAARALNSLGIVELALGQHAPATAHQKEALALFRQESDHIGEANALTSLGLIEICTGQHRPATDHLTAALALFQQVGNRSGEAWALDSLGTLQTALGNAEQGHEYHAEALALFREAGDRDGETWALNGLGDAAHLTGHTGVALRHYTAALALADETGAQDQQARANVGFGHAHSAQSNAAQAREHYERAVALYTALGMPEADLVRTRLAALTPAS
jgi:tetratricopeptide (TPR) repeat protein